MRKVTVFILLALLVTVVCAWLFANSRQSTIVLDVNPGLTKPKSVNKTEIAVTPKPFTPKGWLDYIITTTRLHLHHHVVQYRFIEYMCRVMVGGTLDFSKYAPVCVDRNGIRHEDLFAKWSKNMTTVYPIVGDDTRCQMTRITDRIVVFEAQKHARCWSDILNGPYRMVHAYTGEKTACDCKPDFCTKSEFSDKREQFWNFTRDILATFAQDQQVSTEVEQFIIVLDGEGPCDLAEALSKLIAVQQNASKHHCSALLHFCRNAANGASNVANLGDESYMAFCASAKEYHEACLLRTCDKHDEYRRLVSMVHNEHLRSRFRKWYVQMLFMFMFSEEELNMANRQDQQFFDKRQLPKAVWCFDDNADWSDNSLNEVRAYHNLVKFGDTLFFEFVEFFDPSIYRLVDIAVFVLVVMAVVCYVGFRKWEDISEWAPEALSRAPEALSEWAPEALSEWAPEALSRAQEALSEWAPEALSGAQVLTERISRHRRPRNGARWRSPGAIR